MSVLNVYNQLNLAPRDKVVHVVLRCGLTTQGRVVNLESDFVELVRGADEHLFVRLDDVSAFSFNGLLIDGSTLLTT